MLKHLLGKTWWGPIIHLVIIVAITFVGVLYFFYSYLPDFTNHGQLIEVPNLENLTIEEAQDFLNEKSLRFEISDTVYSERHDKGAIVTQLPSAGAEVKENRRIYLTLNTSTPPKIPVTDATLEKLKGDGIKQVEININNLGLKIAKIDTVESDYKNLVIEAYKEGKIIEVGDILYQGDKIKLDIGRGKIEEIPDTTNTYIGD